MIQEFTSKNTSINKGKLPAIYGKLNWEIIEATNQSYGVDNTVIDYGCGKYTQHIIDFLNEKNFAFYGYDLYNQSWANNVATLDLLSSEQKIGVIICSNLLCVIKEDEIIQDIVNKITATKQPYFFTVWEGNKTGVGKQTGSDQYQRNEKLQNIYEKFFKDIPLACKYKGTICNKEYKKYLKK